MFPMQFQWYLKNYHYFFFPQSVSLAPLPLRLYIQNAKITNVYVQIKVIGNDSLANRMPVFERKLLYGFDSIVKLITWHIKMLKLVNIMIEVYAWATAALCHFWNQLIKMIDH